MIFILPAQVYLICHNFIVKYFSILRNLTMSISATEATSQVGKEIGSNGHLSDKEDGGMDVGIG